MNNSYLVNQNSGKDDWTTPSDLFQKLNDKYGFTLDPCSNDENALCEKHFTREDNGLEQSWANETVFMNPPYGTETGKWIRKAYEESVCGAVVVCLIPARPDTSYWHDYIFPHASEIQFIRGRLHFSNSKQSASFPSAIIVFDSKNDGELKITTGSYS